MMTMESAHHRSRVSGGMSRGWRRSSIADNDKSGVSAEAMLKELRDDNLAFVAKLREVKELAGQAGDNATDGIVDDWTDEAQERAWFLTETLGK